MRLSLWPVSARSWDDLLEVARLADDGGWDGLYVADHFMGDGGGFGAVDEPTLEATAVLAALATATARVRLGSLVLSATNRHPAVLANWAATVDHASGGRLVLGIGAGWQENEHEQYGLALGSPGERISRLDEQLQIIRGLLTQPTTTVHGEHHQVVDALCEPKPLQSPLPILVGGKGDRMLRLVARHADEWNMWSTPASFAERSAALDAACEREGRDPSTIHRSTQMVVLPVADPAKGAELVGRLAPRPAIAGSPTSLAEQFAAYADVGVDEIIVPTRTLGDGAERADFLAALLDACDRLRR
jgi:F420-dependent oxidoreductase-like protein